MAVIIKTFKKTFSRSTLNRYRKDFFLKNINIKNITNIKVSDLIKNKNKNK